MASRDSSSPSRHSSKSTLSPEEPKRLSRKHSRRASSASSSVWATVTPFPAAKPSALTTTGAPRSLTRSNADSYLLCYSALPVGTPAARITSLAKDLDPSMRAASLSGPNMVRPRERKTSTIPATSGASGPTTVRSTLSLSARSASASVSSTSMRKSSASPAIPALPGATNKRPSPGHRFKLLTNACSRPPPPTTRTTIAHPGCVGLTYAQDPIYVCRSDARTHTCVTSNRVGGGDKRIRPMVDIQERPLCPLKQDFPTFLESSVQQ